MKGEAENMWSSGAIYDAYGKENYTMPVLLSVPHAGRAYTPAVLERCRIPHTTLSRLEDRYADLLIAPLLERGYRAIVARTPRAVIDFNRDARDIDARVVANIPKNQPLIQTSKQRGGLGLFPRTLPRIGDIWNGMISWEEAGSRIEGAHGPYHAALESHLDALARRHGEVLLCDIHSMPPLGTRREAGIKRTDIVIGDRFGTSAMSRLAELACATVEMHGLVAAVNHPYSGSYLIERHGQPRNGRHALQIEVSRDLYLDTEMTEPGEGLGKLQAVIADLVTQLAREVSRGRWSEAAE